MLGVQPAVQLQYAKVALLLSNLHKTFVALLDAQHVIQINVQVVSVVIT
jgi:hypothetical protein